MGNGNQTDYPIPSDETERIKRLRSYEILDTAHEETFANLTELASQVFDFPIVLVSLVDEERLWFKSNHGIDFREVEREASLCNSVVCENSSVHLPNTLEDPVARNNSLVQDKGVRSYHGVPLRDDDGYLLGTFCLLDFEERELSDQEKEQLEIFANEAMEKIELKRSEKEERRSAEKNEVLLKELHHRVKNNFQLVMSLLGMKKRELSDPEMSKQLGEIEGRIGSMSLIHELLYRNDDVSEVDPEDFLRKLLEQIRQSHAGNFENIDFESRIEPDSLDVDHAIPCGLIINEWIANVLEHAFEPGEDGRISLAFFREGDRCHLEITDNGKGFEGGFEQADSETLGLRLIRNLAVDQLNGELNVENNDETEFSLVF